MNLNFINGENVSFLLFFIGLYGLMAEKNVIKSVISISLMEVAIILFFITAGTVEGSIPPIGDVLSYSSEVSDPLPQALMITEIVIGLGVTAVSLTLFIHLYHRYRSTNWKKLKDRRRKND